MIDSIYVDYRYIIEFMNARSQSHECIITAGKMFLTHTEPRGIRFESISGSNASSVQRKLLSRSWKSSFAVGNGNG